MNVNGRYSYPAVDDKTTLAEILGRGGGAGALEPPTFLMGGGVAPLYKEGNYIRGWDIISIVKTIV